MWVAGAFAAEPPRDVAAAAFLEGRWHAALQEEHWVRVGDVLVGVGVTKSAFELLHIDARAGMLQYVAQPAGGAATRFSCTSGGPNALVFEDPSHDWPKRIAYARKEDVLTVEVGVGSTDDLALRWKPVKTH